MPAVPGVRCQARMLCDVSILTAPKTANTRGEPAGGRCIPCCPRSALSMTHPFCRFEPCLHEKRVGLKSHQGMDVESDREGRRVVQTKITSSTQTADGGSHHPVRRCAHHPVLEHLSCGTLQQLRSWGRAGGGRQCHLWKRSCSYPCRTRGCLFLAGDVFTKKIVGQWSVIQTKGGLPTWPVNEQTRRRWFCLVMCEIRAVQKMVWVR